MKKLILIAVTWLFCISVFYAQDIEELKATITKINSELSQLMVEGDHKGMLKFYSDDIISMPSYQPMLRGMDDMKKAGEMQEQSGVKCTYFTLETTDVMLAGDYFVEIGKYKISMDIPGMETPWDDHGKYLNVWEEDDEGNMKIAVDIWNTDVNPWMEMQESGEGHHDDYGKPEKKETEEVEKTK